MGYAQCKSFAYVDETVTDDNATRGSNWSAEAELIKILIGQPGTGLAIGVF